MRLATTALVLIINVIVVILSPQRGFAGAK